MTPEEEKVYRIEAHWPGRTAMVEREQMYRKALENALNVLVDVGCFDDHDRIEALRDEALAHRSGG